MQALFVAFGGFSYSFNLNSRGKCACSSFGEQETAKVNPNLWGSGARDQGKRIKIVVSNLIVLKTSNAFIPRPRSPIPGP